MTVRPIRACGPRRARSRNRAWRNHHDRGSHHAHTLELRMTLRASMTLIAVGRDVLSTTLRRRTSSSRRRRCVDEQGPSDNAEWWHVGFASRPRKPDAGSSAAQVVGDERRPRCRDRVATRVASIYGQLDHGETAVFASVGGAIASSRRTARSKSRAGTVEGRHLIGRFSRRRPRSPTSRRRSTAGRRPQRRRRRAEDASSTGSGSYFDDGRRRARPRPGFGCRLLARGHGDVVEPTDRARTFPRRHWCAARLERSTQRRAVHQPGRIGVGMTGPQQLVPPHQDGEGQERDPGFGKRANGAKVNERTSREVTATKTASPTSSRTARSSS